MELKSTAFEDGAFIPSRYTCEGENIHPPLLITDVPKAARSLVLIVSDPDAPSGDFAHWLLWNVPPHTTQLKESEVPSSAVEGKNDFGTFAYGGPCPPSGTHRYEFHLYALDSLINIPQTSTKNDLQSHISGFILEEFVLVGLYAKEA